MADRQVTQSKKDKDGDILALCNPDQVWSPKSKRDAIHDIVNRVHSYYVRDFSGRVNIIVGNGTTGKFLRTEKDTTKGNNLDELPDC